MVRKKDQNVIVSGRGPIVSVAIGLSLSAAIAYNALGRQDVRHPAPFEGFWSLGSSPEEDRPTLLPRGNAGDPLVRELQRELTVLGYYDGAVDGLNGPQTSAAIARYAREHELGGDGQASSEMLDHIKLNKRIRDAVKNPPDQVLIDDSKRIWLVQTGLSELGYAPGPVDGVLGEQTKQAIKTFEKDRRLDVTGRVSDALIRELRAITGLSSLKADDGNG